MCAPWHNKQSLRSSSACGTAAGKPVGAAGSDAVTKRVAVIEPVAMISNTKLVSNRTPFGYGVVSIAQLPQGWERVL